MNKPKLVIGVALAGIVGPALGISGNTLHAWGMIVAAICFSIVGVSLILHEVWSHRR